jgi:hypothetical protein
MGINKNFKSIIKKEEKMTKLIVKRTKITFESKIMFRGLKIRKNSLKMARNRLTEYIIVRGARCAHSTPTIES